MTKLEGVDLQSYIRKMNSDLGTNERFFVDYARHYFRSSYDKVLAIGGLRGTGKTVGLLQSLAGLDAIYLCAQEAEDECGSDYITILKNTDKRYIVIDEYTWIKDRKKLDYFLYTCVQNGKRIAITGTESFTLDFLNYGNLIHRVDMVHVTLFSYDEYLHVYGYQHNKMNCAKYLMEGGVFPEYAIRNYDDMMQYIKVAIIDNLVRYLGDGYDEQLVTQVVYTVLYEAVCSSTASRLSVYNVNHTPLPNHLDLFGIDSAERYPEDVFRRMVNRVFDIFEQVGVIVKIRNAVNDLECDDSLLEQLNMEKTPRYKAYIVNPSLTCQLISLIYDIKEIDNYILGSVFEACMMSYLEYHRLNNDKLYFVDLRFRDGVNKELDALMVRGNDERYLYLFECKYNARAEIKMSNSILSDTLQHFLEERFSNSEIDGRCYVYTGDDTVKNHDGEDYLFTTIGNNLQRYNYISQTIEKIKEKETKSMNQF